MAVRNAVHPERDKAVQRAYARLGEIERRVLWVTYVEDLATPEAAARLGIEPELLGEVAFRARGRLRDEIASARRTGGGPDCRSVSPHLADFVLGSLPEPIATGIGNHLRSCGWCRATHEAIDDIPSALRAVALTRPPGTEPEVEAEDPAPVVPPEVRRTVPVALAIAVLIVAGVAAFVRASGDDRLPLASSNPFFASPHERVDPGAEEFARSAPAAGRPTRVQGARETAPVVTQPTTPPTTPPAPEPHPDPPQTPDLLPAVEPPVPAPQPVTTVIDAATDAVGGATGLVSGLLDSLLNP